MSSPEHLCGRWGTKQQLPAVRGSVLAVRGPGQHLVTVVRQLQAVPRVVALLAELAEDDRLQPPLLSAHCQQPRGYSAARKEDLRQGFSIRV